MPAAQNRHHVIQSSSHYQPAQPPQQLSHRSNRVPSESSSSNLVPVRIPGGLKLQGARIIEMTQSQYKQSQRYSQSRLITEGHLVEKSQKPRQVNIDILMAVDQDRPKKEQRITDDASTQKDKNTASSRHSPAQNLPESIHRRLTPLKIRRQVTPSAQGDRADGSLARQIYTVQEQRSRNLS